MTNPVDPVEIALEVVGQFTAGRFEEAETRFARRLRDVVPASAVAELWRERVGGRAVLARGEVTVLTRPDGLVTATVPLRIEASGDMNVLMSMDDEGLLHGLRFAAPEETTWVSPAYVKRKRFTEREIALVADADADADAEESIGGDGGSVPGTLTLPRGIARLRARAGSGVPAVVLLAGGGPFDRDASAGPNKPLKDLAWGLASLGLAVLRFDKITHTRAAELNVRGFTLSEEYVPHARAAVKLLRAEPLVDPKRVFVLGHSAGGKIAPCVAQQENSVAGLILLAADAAPMHETAVRVGSHIAELNPGPETRAALADLARQAARAADPRLDPSTPAGRLPFSLPACYWRHLREYNQVATAAAVRKPMFIAQGGRDYQVTAEHDLVLWRRGLAGRADVTIHEYPGDDHLFFPGTGPATPASYQVPQHVDPLLITEIATWIRSRHR